MGRSRGAPEEDERASLTDSCQTFSLAACKRNYKASRQRPRIARQPVGVEAVPQRPNPHTSVLPMS